MLAACRNQKMFYFLLLALGNLKQQGNGLIYTGFLLYCP